MVFCIQQCEQTDIEICIIFHRAAAYCHWTVYCSKVSVMLKYSWNPSDMGAILHWAAAYCHWTAYCGKVSELPSDMVSTGSEIMLCVARLLLVSKPFECWEKLRVAELKDVYYCSCILFNRVLSEVTSSSLAIHHRCWLHTVIFHISLIHSRGTSHQ